MKIIMVGCLAESLINFRGHLLSQMVENGHQVVAVANGRNPDIENSLKSIGVEYLPVSIDRTGFNPIKDIATFWELYKCFSNLSPDIVLAYTVKPVIYGSIAASLARVPNIYSIITGLGYAFSGRGKGSSILRTFVVFLYQFALRLNRKVIFQNPDDLNLFIDLKIVSKENATTVAGSGVDLCAYDVAPVVNAPVFLLIARLLKDKGICEYVSAARMVRQYHPKAVFRLLGPLDPNPSGLTLEQIMQWQNEGVIEYLGEVKDVRPHIASSAVYVLPSYREGTPRTVLEAMAMGRAIITTNAPGCRETVQDGKNGFLVQIRDVEQLAEKMKKFIDSPELILKMGEKSREIAVHKYDVHQINKDILMALGLAV